jgi:hypothetical protein
MWSEERIAQRNGRWILRQTFVVTYALAALALGALLLIHGVTLWLDHSTPRVCSLSSHPNIAMCHSVGPWRDLAIPLSAAGAALALFGLGLAPISVRSFKRQFVFRAGTWARVHP